MNIVITVIDALQHYFLLRWILANAAGWSLGLLLALTLGAGLGQWFGLPLLSLILSGTLAGVIVGAFQRLALRGVRELPRRWLWMSALGGMLGAFPAFLLSFTLLFGWAVGIAFMGAAFAGILSALQCTTPNAPHAGWWISANLLGGALCGACSVVAALPILPLVCSAGPPLFGLVTGLALMHVLEVRAESDGHV
jgi:hypothetical protein